MIVCDNIGEHLMGNVYIKFVHEEDSEKCLNSLRNLMYDGK